MDEFLHREKNILPRSRFETFKLVTFTHAFPPRRNSNCETSNETEGNETKSQKKGGK